MLRAVAADTRELRTTPHDAALPFLFARKQVRMEGFKPAVGHGFLSPMSCLHQGTPTPVTSGTQTRSIEQPGATKTPA